MVRSAAAVARHLCCAMWLSLVPVRPCWARCWLACSHLRCVSVAGPPFWRALVWAVWMHGVAWALQGLRRLSARVRYVFLSAPFSSVVSGCRACIVQIQPSRRAPTFAPDSSRRLHGRASPSHLAIGEHLIHRSWAAGAKRRHQGHAPGGGPSVDIQISSRTGCQPVSIHSFSPPSSRLCPTVAAAAVVMDSGRGRGCHQQVAPGVGAHQ